MVRLRGSILFLTVARRARQSRYDIEIYEDFDKAVEGFSSGSRLSPLFPYEAVGDVCEEFKKAVSVIAWGPYNPGDIDLLPVANSLLSLGLHNQISICYSEEERKAVKEFCKRKGVPREEWVLESKQIARVNIVKPEGELTVSADLVSPLTLSFDALKAPSREYQALIASVYTRSATTVPELVGTYERFDQGLRFLLSRDEFNLTTKQKLLVNANAALSRHSSQTYAGTSPILERECYYWTHSLFGVGIASIALMKIRAFLERAVERARLVDRLLALKDQPCHERSLKSIPSLSDFWKEDHLARAAISAGEPTTSERSLPFMTSYSGRDGFRSTQVSISAPLECISSCNTVSWTLQTLTHEVSHSQIDGILGQLLPLSDEALERTMGLLNGNFKPDNLFDQVVAYLCFAIWNAYGKSTEEKISLSELRALLLRHNRSVNETLTHCFDFLYFYRKRPEKYIPSLWISWSVIPDIQVRLPDYLLRSLCALHSTNLSRKGGVEISLKQLEEQLARIEAEYPKADYVSRAYAVLVKDREKFATRLKRYIKLIRLARHFVYSASVSQVFSAETILAAEGDHEGYPLQVLDFPPDKIDNPLGFVEAFSIDKDSKFVRSAWMLHQLAFSESGS